MEIFTSRVSTSRFLEGRLNDDLLTPSKILKVRCWNGPLPATGDIMAGKQLFSLVFVSNLIDLGLNLGVAQHRQSECDRESVSAPIQNPKISQEKD